VRIMAARDPAGQSRDRTNTLGIDRRSILRPCKPGGAASPGADRDDPPRRRPV